MKKVFLLFVALLIAAGIVIYQNPAYLAWFERQSDELLPAAVTHSTTYRWRDHKGQWQLSDTPPGDGVDYEVVEYHKNTNVIPAERLTGKPGK